MEYNNRRHKLIQVINVSTMAIDVRDGDNCNGRSGLMQVQDELVNIVTALGGRVNENTPNQISTFIVGKIG